MPTASPYSTDRPGPGPMPTPLLDALDIAIGRRIDGPLAVEFPDAAVGTGTELSRLRPYVAGDDVRRIDWNATARLRQPHLRVDVADRALTTWLPLDVSPSMSFGTANRRNADVAEGVALALGHVAARRGNRLGVVTFGGQQQRTLPSRQGRATLRDLLVAARQTPEPDGGGTTSVGAALRRVTPPCTRRGLVVVVSDFRGPRDWIVPLAALGARQRVLVVEPRDPREQELPDVGDLWLVDP